MISIEQMLDALAAAASLGQPGHTISRNVYLQHGIFILSDANLPNPPGLLICNLTPEDSRSGPTGHQWSQIRHRLTQLRTKGQI